MCGLYNKLVSVFADKSELFLRVLTGHPKGLVIRIPSEYLVTLPYLLNTLPPKIFSIPAKFVCLSNIPT